MTTYAYYDTMDDQNNNRSDRADVVKATRRDYSDGEENWERARALRGRSQSMKNLDQRVDAGRMPRTKSLRDVDTGDIDTLKARISYADSWNPVSHVGRGKIAKRIQSWENLDAEDWSQLGRFMDGRSRSSSASRAQSFKELKPMEGEYENGIRRSRAASWRGDRWDAADVYDQDSAQLTFDGDAFAVGEADIEVRDSTQSQGNESQE